MKGALLFIAALAWAQAPGADPEVKPTLDALSNYAARLDPVLNQVKPKEWVDKGAPDTYIAQWESARNQCRGLDAAAKSLAQHADRLPDTLELLFRVQSLELTLGSLEDGMRRYQNPALADILSAIRAESTPQREKLQKHALALANDKDQQLQVMDREAQRCRGDLSRQAPRR